MAVQFNSIQFNLNLNSVKMRHEVSWEKKFSNTAEITINWMALYRAALKYGTPGNWKKKCLRKVANTNTALGKGDHAQDQLAL